MYIYFRKVEAAQGLTAKVTSLLQLRSSMASLTPGRGNQPGGNPTHMKWRMVRLYRRRCWAHCSMTHRLLAWGLSIVLPALSRRPQGEDEEFCCKCDGSGQRPVTSPAACRT